VGMVLPRKWLHGRLWVHCVWL